MKLRCIEIVFVDNLSEHYGDLPCSDTLHEEIDALLAGDFDVLDLDMVSDHLTSLIAMCEILRGDE